MTQDGAVPLSRRDDNPYHKLRLIADVGKNDATRWIHPLTGWCPLREVGEESVGTIFKCSARSDLDWAIDPLLTICSPGGNQRYTANSYWTSS